MRTLVVDDSPTIRILLRHLMSTYGDCDVAQNGREAIEAHSRGLKEGRPYDLICLDLGLPYLDGMAVLSRIRATEAQCQPKAKARIVVVTASRDPARAQKASELGADGCFLKPVEPDQFVHYLQDFGFVQARTSSFLALARQIEQLSAADRIPVPVLATLIRVMADSIGRQSSGLTIQESSYTSNLSGSRLPDPGCDQVPHDEPGE